MLRALSPVTSALLLTLGDTLCGKAPVENVEASFGSTGLGSIIIDREFCQHPVSVETGLPQPTLQMRIWFVWLPIDLCSGETWNQGAWVGTPDLLIH